MGIDGETPIILRDVYSKKIHIKKINKILEIDYNNYEIWTNIGWSKIKNIVEEINFSEVFTLNCNIGIVTLTSDLFNNIYEYKLPKYDTNNKWNLTSEQAFLLGYFLKYGILDNRFNLIILETDENCKHIKKFLKIFDKVEGVKSNYVKFDNNKYIIKNIYENLIWNKYFSFCYNDRNEKIIPHVIINSNLLIKTCFLLGYLGQFDYDKIDPFNYLNKCLKNQVFMTISQELLVGLYYICKNIGLPISIKKFEKNLYKYYILYKANPDEVKNKYTHIKNYEIENTNKHVEKTYTIIPTNPNVYLISIGIGELAICIK